MMNRRQLFIGLGATAAAAPLAIAASASASVASGGWVTRKAFTIGERGCEMIVPSGLYGQVESRQFQVEEICKWFGVPPRLIDPPPA